MPSKSKAQHNLMAMVANNPAAAKRLGIPQSVGKEFMKADKRKVKKYGLGGPTSYSGEDTGEGMKMSTRRGGDSGMSFKDAFKAAKDGSVFEWNGKKYKKEYAEKKAPKAEAPKAESPKAEAPTSSGPRSGGRGSKPGMARVGSGRYDDPTSSFGERVMSPFSKLGDIFGRRAEERVMKNMGVSREEARKRIDAKEEAEGMKKGGKVESKKMMKKEVSFMKKKGAPKSMIKHEEAEMKNKMSGGGYRRAADGIASHGKTKGHVIKMREGGSVGSFRRSADGIASKGKTKGKMVRMNKGGYC